MYSVSGLAGLVLAVGAAAFVIAAVATRGRPIRLGASVVVAALGFQLIHVAEHGIQVLVWAGNPSGKPWMSSWAAGTAAGVGEWFSFMAPAAGTKPLGMELLHLLGNVIFLAGLAVMVRLGGLVHRGHARAAVGIQSLHVLEHVVLTSTLVGTGTAHGVSTMIDDVLPVGGPTARVLFHFGINAFATVYAIRAIHGAGWQRWVDIVGFGTRRPEAAPEPLAPSASL